MRWIRRLFLIVCLVLTGVAIWGGVYTRKLGFTESWRNAIEGEFEKRGYYIEIEKITLGAFRGLVAEDVVFYQDFRKEVELAKLDDVYLDVDLSKILSKQISVNTLDVEDARLSLPLDPADPDGPRLNVDDLSGRIVITESMIEIVSAAASVADIDLELTGTLLRPAREDGVEEEALLANEDAFVTRRKQIQRVIGEIAKYEFLRDGPRIAIEFRGDLEDLATMTARARIEAEHFRRIGQTYEVERLDGKFFFNGIANEAEIEELHIRDNKGELSMTGQWSQETNHLEFDLESDVDVSKLVGVFVNDRKLGEVVFFAPPHIQLSGYLDLNRFGEAGIIIPGEVMGQFRAERFVTRGTVFAGVNFGFSAEGERFYIRNLRLDHKSGVAFLNLKYEPGNDTQSIQYHTEVKLDPQVFRPFFSEKGRKLLDKWDFGEASTVYVAAVGQGSDWDHHEWVNKGVVDLRNFRLNGVAFRELEAEFDSEAGYLWLRDITMARTEGEIVAEMAQFSIAEKQWNVKGVVSTVDLIEGARAFNPKLANKLQVYQFETPPTVRLTGLFDGRLPEDVGDEPRNSKFSASFKCDGVGRYEFLGKTLELATPKGSLEIEGSRVHLTKLTAGVLGGAIEVEYDALDVLSEDKPYNATVRISRVPLEAVTRHYGDTEVATGEVDAFFSLSGTEGDISGLNGHGAASIENGELFAMPLLGALTSVIQVSGSTDGVAREAQATFSIEDGVLSTDDFVALTDNMLVRGAGSVSLIDYTVDLEAVVNTRGGFSQSLLTPVSELLTFSGSGTVQEPIWKAKHISNLGKVPAQVITEMTNIPIEGLKLLSQGLLGHGFFGSPEGGNEAAGIDPERGRVTSPGEGLRRIGQGLFGAQGEHSERGGAEGRTMLFPILQNREESSREE
tara:strand:+ start:1473 stop:4181 length:2709 start_codon:yes stop_codon:yes gene_type:complete